MTIYITGSIYHIGADCLALKVLYRSSLRLFKPDFQASALGVYYYIATPTYAHVG